MRERISNPKIKRMLLAWAAGDRKVLVPGLPKRDETTCYELALWIDEVLTQHRILLAATKGFVRCKYNCGDLIEWHDAGEASLKALKRCKQ